MTTIVRLETVGGPDVLQVVTSERLSTLAPNDAWVEHEAIGVNFLDVMQRNGSVAIPLPSGIGFEGSGRVTAIGHDVNEVAVGDRVAYAMGPIGSYASGRAYPAGRLLKLPDTVSFDDAASIVFKGLTAQYLIKETYHVKPDSLVLLYGAAGALGQIMAPWLTHLGATVIGVVSRKESVDRAHAVGCSDVLVWSDDLSSAVRTITNGRMVDVVYDGVGRKTFNASIASLRPRGMMVSIGASSGLPEPISISTLNQKSLFLTRPSLAAHISDSAEYHHRAADLFAALKSGAVKPPAWKSFALSDAAQAHSALETGHAEGAVLLKP